MAQKIGKLTALRVGRPLKPGMYSDGGGLWLQVTPTRDGKPGGKSWIFRYMVTEGGRSRERYMGLGSFSAVSLAAARDEAATCRRQRSLGLDPIEVRKSRRRERALNAATAVTFGEAAQRFIDANEPGWTNPKHASQWRNTLKAYAYPKLEFVEVRAVDTALVLACIEPIWKTKTETANRVRGRIEAILDSAKARGQREGENPARWKGHLENLLPQRSKVKKRKHHPALPYSEVGKFMAELRGEEGTAARALRFLILTAARTGAVVAARWDEVDLHNAVWVVPEEQGRKLTEPHRVPLCGEALESLREQKREHEEIGDDNPYIFPGKRKGRGLSTAAMSALLARIGHDEITVHGFRSTFRDWAAEETNFPRELAEKALAHIIGDETERAYQRGDLFKRRQQLMSAWERYCANARPAKAGKVVSFRA